MDEDHPKIPTDKDRDLEMLEVVKPNSRMWTPTKVSKSPQGGHYHPVSKLCNGTYIKKNIEKHSTNGGVLSFISQKLLGMSSKTCCPVHADVRRELQPCRPLGRCIPKCSLAWSSKCGTETSQDEFMLIYVDICWSCWFIRTRLNII